MVIKTDVWFLVLSANAMISFIFLIFSVSFLNCCCGSFVVFRNLMFSIMSKRSKTSNLYAFTKTSYHKLLRNNITKSYKQAPAQTYNDINEVKDIAHSLELSSRMNCFARKETFIILEDHKENFTKALPCRLINPVKSEMGRVSKAVLDRILKAVDQKLNLNMRRNTAAVTEWFTKIDRKERATLFCFDVVDFYPSITEDLLKRALLFAEQYTTISDQENDVFLH